MVSQPDDSSQHRPLSELAPRRTSLSTVTGGAIFRHRAAFAFGADWTATSLAEGYDMRVPRLPVFDQQDLTQSHLGFERRFRIHELPSVADAVNMYINTDRRKVEADRYSQIRGLASYAR